MIVSMQDTLAPSSNSSQPSSPQKPKQQSTRSQRSRGTKGRTSLHGSEQVGQTEDLIPGSFNRNLMLITRYVDQKRPIIANIRQKNIDVGIAGSSQACALADWCFDIAGSDCSPRVMPWVRDGKETFRVAFNDRKARKRFYLEPLYVEGLPGQFDPRLFDEGRAKPGITILKPLRMTNLPIDMDPDAPKRGKAQREAGKRYRKVGPREWTSSPLAA